MKARVVIGASFGDEGKGLVTDYLCSHGAGVVIRFNGGAQAGHTVVSPNGDRHVFRHFGSGTFLGVPTFLSEFFIVNPILFLQEQKQLLDLGYKPMVFADPECLVTTFADMWINQFHENARGSKRHGSCGVGVRETIVRSGIPELKITMGDVWDNPKAVEHKLSKLAGYVHFRTKQTIPNMDQLCQAFLAGCQEFANLIHPLAITQCKDPVFEGAQGLLLDQDNKEYFPHVTPSNTGMKNVRTLLRALNIAEDTVDIYYVSRTYLTRHGAGPLPGEDPKLQYEDKTNNPTTFQGSIRFAPLDYRQLVDRCAKDAAGSQFRLVLTHCDQHFAGADACLYSTGETRDHLSVDKPQVVVT